MCSIDTYFIGDLNLEEKLPVFGHLSFDCPYPLGYTKNAFMEVL
jgi:hypothetical protein